MRFTITAQVTDIPLELNILGYHIEVADLDTGSISVSASDGHISVCYVEAQAFPLTQVSNVDTVADTPQTEVVEPDLLQSVEAETVHIVEIAVDAEQIVISDPTESKDQTEQLFLILSTLRKQIAIETKLPPYIIFHDNTLRDMCKLLPSSIDELSSIHGIGKAKLEKYGLRFLQAIQEYIAHLKEVA